MADSPAANGSKQVLHLGWYRAKAINHFGMKIRKILFSFAIVEPAVQASIAMLGYRP